MLKFRDMTDGEFIQLIKNEAIEDYIKDIEVYREEFMKTFKGKTPKEFAEEQFKQNLVLGVKTPYNFFWIAIKEDTNEEIGYIWFTIMLEKKVSLLTNIRIKEEFQGQGLGTEMIHYWEKHVIDTYPEVDGVYLHCFRHNTRAKKLYDQLGFKLLQESFDGWNMIKAIHREK